jgi:hypothetical protein
MERANGAPDRVVPGFLGLKPQAVMGCAVGADC